jgi:hypothetical protein
MFVPGINQNKSLGALHPITHWPSAGVAFSTLEEAVQYAIQWTAEMTQEALVSKAKLEALGWKPLPLEYSPVVMYPGGEIRYV